MKSTKLSPRTIIYCTQLVLLAFASAAIMGLLVKAETISELVGSSCEGTDCNPDCSGNKRHGCCPCPCPPPPPPPPKPRQCNMGLGRCSFQCNQQCCAQKCAAKFRGGVGTCDDRLGLALALCQCQYPC